jgi:uncharacterized protein (DUF433 family)
VEHILGVPASGEMVNNILEGYPRLEDEDIQAGLIYAHRVVGNERIELLPSIEGLHC